MRILGLDPGASHVGLCVLSTAPAGVRLIHGSALSVGHEAPRAAVKRDKAGRESTSIRVLDDGDLVALRIAVRELLMAHPVDLVAIERVRQLTGRAPGGAGAAIGAAMSDAQWVGGELAGLARGFGFEVMTCAAGEWRAALTGKRNATDAEIATLVPLAVQGWPARSSSHARDAAGVALYAANRARAGRAA